MTSSNPRPGVRLVTPLPTQPRPLKNMFSVHASRDVLRITLPVDIILSLDINWVISMRNVIRGNVVSRVGNPNTNIM